MSYAQAWVFRCDHTNGDKFCATVNYSYSPLARDAKKAARKAGWFVADNGLCFCPEHAKLAEVAS